MKAQHVLLVVAAALICGGIAGYASARLANGGARSAGPEPTIAAVEQIRFIDGSGNHLFTLEPGAGRTPGLVLKDSTGRPLCNLPPLLRALPVERR